MTADEQNVDVKRHGSKRHVRHLTLNIIGATLSIIFIVSGAAAGLMLAAELDAQPRTQDAYTRANMIEGIESSASFTRLRHMSRNLLPTAAAMPNVTPIR